MEPRRQLVMLMPTHNSSNSSTVCAASTTGMSSRQIIVRGPRDLVPYSPDSDDSKPVGRRYSFGASPLAAVPESKALTPASSNSHALLVGRREGNWEVVLHHAEANRSVLYNRSTRKFRFAADVDLDDDADADDDGLPSQRTGESVCPLCGQPTPNVPQTSPLVAAEYFDLLRKHHTARTVHLPELSPSCRPIPTPLPDPHEPLPSLSLSADISADNDATSSFSVDHVTGAGPEEETLSDSAFNTGYYSRFFREDCRIGRGGYGGVYRAYHVMDTLTLGTYAVKKIPVGNSRRWLEAVLKEVKALEILHHPNIVDYKHSWLEYCKTADFGPKVPTIFVLMEYANCGSLSQYIWPDDSDNTDARKRHRRSKTHRAQDHEHELLLDEHTIFNFFIDTCLGLRHLHSHGIMHRDIKPDNLLLTTRDGVKASNSKQPVAINASDLRVLISDFGSVKMFTDPPTRTGNTGTLLYCAPEALHSASHTYDEKCDIWSLGVVLYAMMYSQVPFNGDDPDSLLHEMQSKPVVFPALPKRSDDLKDLVKHLLALRPQDRPSIEEILSHPTVRRHDYDHHIPADIGQLSGSRGPSRSESAAADHAITASKARRVSRRLLKKRRAPAPALPCTVEEIGATPRAKRSSSLPRSAKRSRSKHGPRRTGFIEASRQPRPPSGRRIWDGKNWVYADSSQAGEKTQIFPVVRSGAGPPANLPPASATGTRLPKL